MENEKNLSALKNFLMDIDCLEKLENNSFNLFDVLKIARAEIRHSNVISWLLDPNENHGLGNNVITALNLELIKMGLIPESEVFKILTMSYEDIAVYRERNRIDILVESLSEKYILCIENKVGTQDHGNQLDTYFDFIEKTYPDFTKIYLYLTPEGLQPLNDSYDIWKCVKYETFISIFETQTNRITLDNNIKSFINSYIEILKRETMENNEIVLLCQKIYREHKIALDLIFENRPDKLLNISDFFKKWCKKKSENGEIIFDDIKCSKSRIRFRTYKMDQYIGKSENLSFLGTHYHYYYEIFLDYDKKDNIKYNIKLVLNSTGLNNKELDRLNDIIKTHSKNQLKKDWQFNTIFKTQSKTISEQEELPELYEDNNDLFKDLDKLLDEVLKKEQNIVKR